MIAGSQSLATPLGPPDLCAKLSCLISAAYLSAKRVLRAKSRQQQMPAQTTTQNPGTRRHMTNMRCQSKSHPENAHPTPEQPNASTKVCLRRDESPKFIAHNAAHAARTVAIPYHCWLFLQCINVIEYLHQNKNNDKRIALVSV